MSKSLTIITLIIVFSFRGFGQYILCENGVNCESPCDGVPYQYHLYVTNPYYHWFTVPTNCGTFPNGDSTQYVTVIWSGTGYGQLKCEGYNPGSGMYWIMDVTRYSFPTPTIQGLSTPCINSTENYSTEPSQNNYSWNVVGGTILNNTGYNISVHWTTVGNGSVSVSYSNGSGCVGDTIKTISVISTPIPTIISEQPDTVCLGSNTLYRTQGGMETYNWEVVGGDKVQQDSICYVSWNSGTIHTIKVTCTKNGWSSTSLVKGITVVSSVPPNITGESNVCDGNTYSYTTDSGKTNYYWDLPDGGGTIIPTIKPDSIRVLWSSPIVNHTLFVRYTNLGLCESSQTKSTYVYPTPQSIVTNGDTSVVVGHQSVYSTSTGFSSYHWSLSEGGTIIGDSTLSQVTVNWSEIGSQWVRVRYSTGLCSSNPIDYPVSVTPSICLVTYDSTSNKNKVVINPENTTGYNHYNIYKLGNTSTLELLGTISTNQSEFIDTTSIPYQTPYTYRVSVGNPESEKSPSHTTIWLHYEKTGNQVDLIWTPYSGFTFDSYHIYRKVGSGNWNQIGLVNNTNLVFTDIYPGTESPSYYIEVIPPCSTKSSGLTVTSNKVKIGGVGIDTHSSNRILIYPNPVRTILTVETPQLYREQRRITISDLLGKIWFLNVTDQDRFDVNVESLPVGIYLLKIEGVSSVITTKFCKE